jgi:hypothetical protein
LSASYLGYIDIHYFQNTNDVPWYWYSELDFFIKFSL